MSNARSRSAPSPETRDNVGAIGWALISVASTSGLFLLMRAATLTVDFRFAVFLRFTATFALAVLFVALFAGYRRTVRFSRPELHLARGFFFFVSAHLGIYAIAELELVTATVLMFTAPLFATLFSVIFNGERVGPRRLGAVAVGFLGVLIVLRPDVGGVEPAMASALGSAVLFAAALVMGRNVARNDGPLATLISAAGITAVCSVPLAWPVADWQAAEAAAGILAAMVLAGIVRMLADIRAYASGDAAVIAPVTYLRLVLVGIGGYLIWSEVPDAAELAGAAIIAGSALYVARREARLKRAAAATPPPPAA